jgi:peroxiredoxin
MTEQTIPAVGDEAPDFTLPTHNEGDLNLSWYRGRKNVLLAFYPADWTPICAAQIPTYQSQLDLFEQYNCQLLAISVDSVFSHLAWAKSLGGLSFPLMSDYFPHGRVAALYGILTRRGYADRLTFLIDKQGKIRYIEKVQFTDQPDTTELFRQLALLESVDAT